MKEHSILVRHSVRAALCHDMPHGTHYYSVFLASGQNRFTQASKQSACNQRSPLIAFNRDDQEKDRLQSPPAKMVFLEADTLQCPPVKKIKLKVMDLALASAAAVAGILHARHPPPSMHPSRHPLDLPALESYRLRIC
jgi:hypothetical protein